MTSYFRDQIADADDWQIRVASGAIVPIMNGGLNGSARALAVCLAVVAVSCDGGAPTATALPQLASNSITSPCTSSAFIAKVNDAVILQIPDAFEPVWYRQLCG